jgi:serine/threonine-protein kinase
MSGDLQRLGNLETILRPGQVVGEKYRVEKLIARGGMAAVWAGVNERTGKRVALKVILRSFAAIGEAAELFHREALAASKVNHPSVVSIFDVIDHEGMTCIVMELLDGETLASYLARNGPLSLDEAVTLLLPAMRGVAAANAQGVVHRDLKPGNIFLCTDTDGRLLATKVLDFGISTMTERVGETSTEIAWQSTFGTPAYMSPEAIESSPDIDGRADVYGFGVLFFEALTGQVPFPGEPGTELLVRIVTQAPPKVTAYRPDLPAAIEHIIDCALAKDANNRFPDMEHMIRAIEDQLVPPLPLRAVTPIAGVSQRPAVESDSGGAHQSDTKQLYALGASPAHLAVTAAVPRKMKLLVAITINRALSALPLVRHMGRPLRRRAAIGATFAVVLIVTTWLTVSRPSSGRGLGKGQSSSSSQYSTPMQDPKVSPLPSTPSPAPSPAASTGGPTESLATSEPTQPNRPTSLTPASATPGTPTSLLGTPHESLRASDPPSSTHVVGTQATRSRPRHANPPRRTSAPRAGRLSASDF